MKTLDWGIIFIVLKNVKTKARRKERLFVVKTQLVLKSFIEHLTK